VKHDIEEDLRFFHPKERLKKDEVTRTADGKKFGQSLNDSKENGLKDIDFNAPSKMSDSKVS